MWTSGLQVMGQILTAPVAGAYRQELKRWLDGKVDLPLVEFEQNTKYPDYDKEIAAEKVLEWIKT